MQIGLTSEQARVQKHNGLSNIKIDSTQKTTKDIIKENIFTYFNLIFLVLAILVIAAGSWKSLTFLPVVIANIFIGIIQEIRAKNILDKLSVISEPTVSVVRDGEEKIVQVNDIVLDDVIILRSGSQIPADAVIIDGEVSVNEALLTGEADEITKTRGKELMSGSFVVSGQCLARLIRVGANSYISKLTVKAKKMSSKEQSEMVKSIDRFVITAGILIIPVGICLLVQGLDSGNSFSDSVVSMVAAVVGMIPEGLYLLVSVTLVMSTVRLAMNKIMLHDMKSIETLARVDVLCLDKTGTITDNSMLVADAIPADDSAIDSFDENKKLIGDYIATLPDDNITMKALDDYFTSPSAFGSSISFLPFSSKFKYSSVQFEFGTFVLGAPEILLKDNYAKYSDKVNSYASKGLRVLVFGRYYTDDDKKSVHVPMEGLANGKVDPLIFILLQNPIRENARDTFAFFEKQGVELKVISGDNPVTVAEVARSAGIKNADRYVNAAELKSTSDIEIAVKKYTVFGRVSPDQKQLIVRALQKDGHTVAMTGDGVNDILAMKDADCSVAIAAGAEAAVQAAQVVLVDSDFSKMPGIVGEGRRIINNIERSSTLFLVKNIFSLLLAIVSIINVWIYPLQPSQISLVSAFNIGIPAFFLAMEPNDKRIKGNFMLKVLLKSMPAALTNFFAIAAMVVFGNYFGVSEADISVASTFLLTIVGFMILIRISLPLNKYRIAVISGCAAGFIFMAVLFSDLFSISYISVDCIMLFSLFAIATEPCMRYLTMLFEFLEKKFQRLYKKRKLKH